MGDDSNRTWWGATSFALQEQRHWRIGPLDLWIQRLEHEWLVQRFDGSDALDSSLAVADDEAIHHAVEPDMVIDRIVGEQDGSALRLEPVLADRAVVARPANALRVLAGSRVQLFLSSPLWLRLSLAGSEAPPMIEFPIFRPSDTWFGPSTIEGQFAYAVKTTCRLDASNLPFRPHRAVTAVVIENTTNAPLVFERLAVPVSRLSLYCVEGSRLWTDTLVVRHTEPGSGLADVEQLDGPSSEAGAYERVAEPRDKESSGLLRVFDQMF